MSAHKSVLAREPQKGIAMQPRQAAHGVLYCGRLMLNSLHETQTCMYHRRCSYFFILNLYSSPTPGCNSHCRIIFSADVSALFCLDAKWSNQANHHWVPGYALPLTFCHDFHVVLLC